MDENQGFQHLLKQVQSAALNGTELPENLHQQVTTADLDAFNRQIGDPKMEFPEGAFDHLPNTSIEWANATTIYRERFETLVFGLAAEMGQNGLDFLLETALSPIPDGEDKMSWIYAKGTALRWAGTCVANSDAPGELLDLSVIRMQAQTEMALQLLPEFLRGISFWRGEAPQKALEDLLKLCHQAREVLQHHVDWDFAQIFRLQAPELCRTVASEQLQRLNGQPMTATLVDQLSFILSLKLFFPDEPLLHQSISKTVSLWLSNGHFVDGLYLLLSVWNHPHFAPAIDELKQHLPKLEQIAQGQMPEPGSEDEVNEIEKLRAHMILSKLSELPGPHCDYIRQIATTSSPLEQAYFEKWLGEA